MKLLKHLFSAIIAIIQKYTYISLGIGLLLLILIGATSFALINQSGHKAPAQAETNPFKPAEAKDEKPNAQVVPPQPVASQQSTPISAKPTQSVPATAKSLIISPSNFSVKAGEPLTVVIKAGDGKAINYPLFDSRNYNGNFTINFAAGPAKTTWSGPILTSKDMATGTYKLSIIAQDQNAAYYRGDITVTVVLPTMNIAIQSLGYDQDNDVLNYQIKINRLYGFDESVTEVAAFSASEPGLGCYYDIIDADTISLACGHDDANEDRPTSGTLTISIGTDSIDRSNTVSYSLPPL